ncbi:MAG: guanylate kinase [Elusimicrobiaceae bacterium]|nr:guanylate kinase [Elusimicrobiaceae bacterium]
MQGFVLVVSSPSGAGKTTMVRKVLKTTSALERVVTATTREPRKRELNGKDYHFWTIKKFENAIKTGKMLEYAKVHNNYYGVSKKSVEDVLKRGGFPVLIIDVQGAQAIKKQYKENCVMVFIAPPSMKELENRIKKRNDDTKNISLRLKTAKKEMAKVKMYDYVIINEDLKIAVQRLRSIESAEKHKVWRKEKDLKKSKLI